jgi:hypothetical protein
MTREQWLHEMVSLLRVLFYQAGYLLPGTLRVACGWPSHGALRSKQGRVIGQCWHPLASADRHTEIFISPVLAAAEPVIATLVHELVHAAVGVEHGHGAAFKRCALALGLTGKMTATVAGPALQARIAALVAVVGQYPHASLDMEVGRKKQTTRLVKAQCTACGYTIRTTRQWLAVGLPTCPCGEAMHEA